MSFKIKQKELFCLIFILVLASFFRLWKLDSIPPNIYPDEAMNANEAISNPGKVFYTENNGREGLFINLIALSFKIFGISIWSFKIVPAAIGILTVFGLYLLTKELFETINNNKLTPKTAPPTGQVINNQFVALFSALFLAASFWHINFSRIGFRAILVPLISIFAFYFLLKALKRRTVLLFVASGALFGLGLYTYISFRMIFLVLPVLFLFWRKKNKIENKKIVYFCAAALIIALPLIIYFISRPQDFASRTTGVLVFNQENPIKTLFNSLLTHILMFNFKGDPNWRHNIAYSPALFWPVGILFLIGLCCSIKELVLSFKNRKKSFMFHVSCFMLVWFFIMLLPGILTYEGIPHSLRCIGAIPPTFIFAGLGAGLTFQFFKQKISLKSKGLNYYLIIFALVLLASSFVLAQYLRYFELWAKNPNLEWAFTKKYNDVGHYLNSLPSETKKYVIVNRVVEPLYGISIPAQTPMFIESTKFGQPRAAYIKAENLDKIEIEAEKTIIIPLYEEKIFEKLYQKFPNGIIKQKNDFYAFVINAIAEKND